MESSSGMKGYFKQQKKKPGAISKPKPPSKRATSSKPPKRGPSSASVGSHVVQPPALVSDDGSLDLEEGVDGKEEILRQFDMNMAYGPCLGMSRIERWERAKKLGLNPPELVESLIKTGKVGSACLWDGRV